MIHTRHINTLTREALEALGQKGQLIDVRTKEEYEEGHIKHAILHPLDQINSFERDKSITYYIHCKSGRRSLEASQMLSRQGFDVVHLDGGYDAYASKYSNDETTERHHSVSIKNNIKQLNYSGLQCPGPIVNLSQEMQKLDIGEQVEVTVTDFGFCSDIKSWVKQTGHTLVDLTEETHQIKAVIQKEDISKKKDMTVTHQKNNTTIVLFSGELDKAIAALIIANGAKAAGRDVTIFFTFWGLNAIKKDDKVQTNKKGIAKMFDLMLPSTPVKMPISKMNMFGLGNLMMRYVMKKKNVDSLPSLINQAIKQDIKLIACTMSMDVMGITKAELRDEVEYGGVGTYIGDTENSSHNLFI
ncbi:DsrE/DsrF/DrsH-like family protein [Staphylococcus felis]|uniref:DsrE/DsrF/DrsH-like family protein n=1 Tax=Staphylococcus felis TaxID=46127 RepID=UPI000E24EFDE|nr:DsrE/DsrF/DrsH-like family protein [Staphylococcus felis]REI27893.1 dihydroneopterin aldolase [Staphylococcus felis]